MPPRSLSIEQEERLSQLFQEGAVMADLEKEFGCVRQTIRRTLNRLGIVGRTTTRTHSNACRKYWCNFNFFDVIDTEEKAYVLGLLYADGCNYEYKWIIELTDLELLEQVRDAICGTYKILETKSRSERHKPTYTLRVHSRHMCEQLAQKGCVKAKSLKLTFPSLQQVPSDLRWHFVRGYFDGDGSVWQTNGRLGVMICGTESFLRELAALMPFSTCIRTPDGRIPTLMIQSQAAVKQFADLLYANATIWLGRKRDRFA